ncbi:class II fructose-bisphosphate aldolase [Tessaracoccus sp. OS52]|uniref:class II fructose-bisphosphate aldolase n=1 Tax=Tessaracoccus sp. OS52 TaxID=2886691 RepID=UPI001D0F4BB2|nr:class II fructose-bisphosphate aldolase [Tessaracoccus sp. OS52]MCC2593967.1 class II fructose-bisphosphate aldolase [Tessaracoccus sp. OS52]
MPISTLPEILAPAFKERYGVPAINVFNELSMASVLEGAAEVRSPLIVQTSVKTVKQMGARTIRAIWESLTRDLAVPVALHLDHCPDRAVITECLENGWNSVLFDAHELPVEENQRQTIEVVEEARRHGAAVEGEIEAIMGVEDGLGSDAPSERQSLDVQLRYLEATGVDVFAPALGNAHGAYKTAPVLDFDRVSAIVEAHPVPIALHGGSGLSDDQFREMISRGTAKVNISTALKHAFMKSGLEHLKECEAKDKWEPVKLFDVQAAAMRQLAMDMAKVFGSAGRA